jgi:hypothetical protein
MKLDDIVQPPFNTCLMGVVKGVLDHFGVRHSPAWVFGGSGHAFLINIHERLCPSGPYCWKYDGLYPLVRNLGLEMIDLGFFDRSSGRAERTAVEQKLAAELDQGRPGAVINLDDQIVCGYDETKLLLTQPWCNDCPTTPSGLTFGTWQEFGDEVHASFFAFRQAEPAPQAEVVRASLRYALDLFRSPGRYQLDRYAIGLAAYDNWTKAAAEHGASHGNWWNATVWSECRTMAGGYFAEIAGKYPALAEPALELSRHYRAIADLLSQVSSKEMPAGEKTARLNELSELEARAIGRIEAFTHRFDLETRL